MQVKNAGFFVRAAALLQDSLINALILMLPFVFFSNRMLKSDSIDSLANMITFCLIAIFLLTPLQALYYSYFTAKFGGTIGKLIFGLKVLDRDSVGHIEMKRAFLRYIIGYAFSAKFFFLGFIRVFKNKEKLTWHDELFNTKVVSEGKAVVGIILMLLTIGLIGFVLYTNFFEIINKIN